MTRFALRALPVTLLLAISSIAQADELDCHCRAALAELQVLSPAAAQLELLQSYHGSAVPPFCSLAARTFFSQF